MTWRTEHLAEGVTLYCGDMLEILPTLGEFDACVTDPPYGIGFAAQPTRYQRINGLQKSTWDDQTPAQAAIDLMLSKSVSTIVWGGNYFVLPPSRGWLVWLKAGNAPSMADLEMAWTSMNVNARCFEKSVKSASLEKNLQSAAHPTQKPVDLMAWCIDQLPADVGTILDPFMGSGTTGVAAIKRGKAFYGIEREPKYFDIACRRISEALKSPDMFIPAPKPKATQESLL